MLVAGAAAVLVAVVVAVVVLAVRPGTAPGSAAPPGPTAAPAITADPVGTGSARRVVSASCVAPPSQDGGGNAVGYDAANTVDGFLDTAWRCDGDGRGEQLRVDLGRNAVVTEIGMIPGYAKSDPVDGSDRYAQNRRIAQVRYGFDDGTSVMQDFDVSPANRSTQVVRVDAVVTRTVTITILASSPGLPTGSAPASDRVAISELLIRVDNGE